MTHTISIMQPHYLPYQGYYELMAQADLMVLLDDVHIQPGSWQTRNRIQARDGSIVWLHVPVHAHRGQHISDVTIDNNQAWQAKTLRTLTNAYQHTDYWDAAINALLPLDTCFQYDQLADLTHELIDSIALELGIDTPTVRATQLALPPSTHPRQHIAHILEATNADELANTLGAREWLGTQPIPTRQGPVPIRYHEHKPNQRPHNAGQDTPSLSIIDSIARNGPEQTAAAITTAYGRGVPA